MPSLETLLNPDIMESLVYPVTIMEGSNRRSQWNSVDHSNNVDCEGLTHWPGSPGVLPCCHVLNPIRFGLIPSQVEYVKGPCSQNEHLSPENYVSSEPDMDCCNNTTYKGIPMNLSRKGITELNSQDYPNKDLVLDILQNEPLYYTINNQDELIQFIMSNNLMDDDGTINLEEARKYEYKMANMSFGDPHPKVGGRKKSKRKKTRKRKNKSKKKSKSRKKSK